MRTKCSLLVLALAFIVTGQAFALSDESVILNPSDFNAVSSKAIFGHITGDRAQEMFNRGVIFTPSKHAIKQAILSGQKGTPSSSLFRSAKFVHGKKDAESVEVVQRISKIIIGLNYGGDNLVGAEMNCEEIASVKSADSKPDSISYTCTVIAIT